MLAWGGWELVFTCNLGAVSSLKSEFQQIGRDFNVIGTAKKKKGNPVVLCDGQKMYSISDFSSKRFDGYSYLTFGLDKYIEQLRKNQFEPI